MSFAISIIIAFIGVPYLIIRCCCESFAAKNNAKNNKISNYYRDKLREIQDFEFQKEIERQLFENRYSYAYNASEDSIMAKNLEILRRDKVINLVKKTPNGRICYEWKQDYSDSDMMRLIMAMEGMVMFDDLFAGGFQSPDCNYTKALYTYMKQKHKDIRLLKIIDKSCARESLSYAWIFGDIEHSRYNGNNYSATYYDG